MASVGLGHGDDGVYLAHIGKLTSAIDDRKYFTSSHGKDRHPYPVGYCVIRRLGGHMFTLRIAEGASAPLFTGSCDCEGSPICEGKTADHVWRTLLKTTHDGMSTDSIRKAKSMAGKQAYGFHKMAVRKLLLRMMSASSRSDSGGDGVEEFRDVVSGFETDMAMDGSGNGEGAVPLVLLEPEPMDQSCYDSKRRRTRSQSRSYSLSQATSDVPWGVSWQTKKKRTKRARIQAMDTVNTAPERIKIDNQIHQSDPVDQNDDLEAPSPENKPELGLGLGLGLGDSSDTQGPSQPTFPFSVPPPSNSTPPPVHTPTASPRVAGFREVVKFRGEDVAMAAATALRVSQHQGVSPILNPLSDITNKCHPKRKKRILDCVDGSSHGCENRQKQTKGFQPLKLGVRPLEGSPPSSQKSSQEFASPKYAPLPLSKVSPAPAPAPAPASRVQQASKSAVLSQRRFSSLSYFSRGPVSNPAAQPAVTVVQTRHSVSVQNRKTATPNPQSQGFSPASSLTANLGWSPHPEPPQNPDACLPAQIQDRGEEEERLVPDSKSGRGEPALGGLSPVLAVRHPLPVLSVMIRHSLDHIRLAVVCGEGSHRLILSYRLLCASLLPPCHLDGSISLTVDDLDPVTAQEVSPERNGMVLDPSGTQVMAVSCFSSSPQRDISAAVTAYSLPGCSHGQAAEFSLETGFRSWCLATAGNGTLLVGGEGGRLAAFLLDRSGRNVAKRWSLPPARQNGLPFPRLVSVTSSMAESACCLAIACSHNGSVAVWDVEKEVLLTTACCPLLSLSSIHAVNMATEGLSHGCAGRSASVSEESMAVPLLVAARKQTGLRNEGMVCRAGLLSYGCFKVGQSMQDRFTAMVSVGGVGAAGTCDGNIYVWSVEEGRLLNSFELNTGCSVVAMAADGGGSCIASGDDNGDVVVYAPHPV